MAYDRCWFVVRAPDDAAAAQAAARAELLARFYGRGGGAAHLSLCRIAPLGLVAGALTLGAPASQDGMAVWGASPPGGPPAGDDALRAWRGPGSLVAWSERAARVMTATVDLAAAYAVGDRAFSSHAVAAAFLATGRAEVRPEALAELLAFGHPAGDATLLRGVRALPAATVIDLHRDGVAQRCVLAPAERWALTGERHAHTVAARELDALLEEVVPAAPWLALSAGLDSRVLAVALAGRGTPVPAYTWGGPGDADVRGAREVAAALGLAHRVVELELLDPALVDAASREHARWVDGAEGLVLTRPAPGDLATTTTLTGVGGELGRAYHYALLARNHRRPDLRRLCSAWRPETALRDAASRAHVRRCADAELERAAAIDGIDGWRVLDVAYAQARMRRWTRGRIAPYGGATVPAFLTPGLAAALVSQSLDDRLTGAFHRGVIAARAPDLDLPPPAGQRRGVPAPVRRAAAVLRRAGAARRPSGRVPGAPIDPRLLAVARHPLVVDTLGRDLAARVGEGRPDALAAARALAGPVTLFEEITAVLSARPGVTGAGAT